jgi:hypothetical protein
MKSQINPSVSPLGSSNENKKNNQQLLSKNSIKNLALTFLLVFATTNLHSQEKNTKEYDYSNRFSVLFGLIQPVALSGFNVEVNYFTKKMVFDYSHGVSLDPPSIADVKDQNVVWHLPYSTGFGVGCRLTNSLDIRFEPKLHSWEAYYKDDTQNDQTRIKDFKTVTLGIGVYYRYFPFKNSNNKFLQGITTSSSVRWWQNTSSTLDGGEFTYFNKTTRKNETLKTPNIGLANTPIVINIGIGYTFGGK